MNFFAYVQQTSEVMNAEVFSALISNVSKLHEMKKVHEDMATELVVLRLEKANAISKLHWTFTSPYFTSGFNFT